MLNLTLSHDTNQFNKTLQFSGIEFINLEQKCLMNVKKEHVGSI